MYVHPTLTYRWLGAQPKGHGETGEVKRWLLLLEIERLTQIAHSAADFARFLHMSISKLLLRDLPHAHKGFLLLNRLYGHPFLAPL